MAPKPKTTVFRKFTFSSTPFWIFLKIASSAKWTFRSGHSGRPLALSHLTTECEASRLHIKNQQIRLCLWLVWRVRCFENFAGRVCFFDCGCNFVSKFISLARQVQFKKFVKASSEITPWVDVALFFHVLLAHRENE